MTNSMSKAPSKVVLITGASSGIGEATARRLAGDGHRIFLGARRAERLAIIAREIKDAGGEADLQELDVTELAGVKRFVAAAHEKYGRIDVMVNNAGVMPLSLVQELRVDEWNQMIDVNLRGVLHGIAAALPFMRQQHSGHIINVSSVAGHRVEPTAAVYCATKFAVRALSEGLRQENKEVRVTVISPGLTQSELLQGIKDPNLKAAVDKMTDRPSIPASAIADAIAYAIGQPEGIDVNEVVVRPTAQG